MKDVTRIGILVVILTVLLITGIVLFNNGDDTTGQALPGIGGGPGDNRTITDIVQNPEQYIGERVTLEGEIDKVLSPSVFVLDQMGTPIGDEILVISGNPLSDRAQQDINNPFRDGDQVTVSGTVQRRVITEIERDFAFDLDPQLEIQFQERPVIEATSVIISPSE